MEKYVRKPVEVEAEQYFNGKEIKGVNITHPEIIYSLDGRLFYLSHCDAKDWLSIEKVKKEDGEKYYSFPFYMYEVKSGKRELVDVDSNLAQLYLSIFNLDWPVPYAWVVDKKGKSITVKNGSWVVFESEDVYVYNNEDFLKKFEKL